MPKNRKIVKIDGATKVIKVPAGLRIGTRKSGVSANSMSTAKLLDIVTDKNKKRYWDNALTVLKKRKVNVSERLT